MSTRTLPTITTQTQLHQLWQTLMEPLGFGARTLWIMVVLASGRPIPQLTEICDLPSRPTREQGERIGDLVAQVLQPGERIAFLLSRPGRDHVTDDDRQWAAMLYGACADAGVRCETVHRANDSDVVPLPLDELPSAQVV